MGVKGFDEFKAHPWFTDGAWDALGGWDALEAKTMTASFVPDTSKANCDTGGNDLVDAFGGAAAPDVPPASEQAKFEGYDYNTDLVNPTKAVVVCDSAKPSG